MFENIFSLFCNLHGLVKKCPDSLKFLYFRQSCLNETLAPEVFDYEDTTVNPKVGTVPKKIRKVSLYYKSSPPLFP